jgi:hypothetical protein
MAGAANTGHPHIRVDYDIHGRNDCIYAIIGQRENQRCRVPVLCPSQVVSGGFRWRFTPKIPAVFLAFGSHDAEVEGSSPSLTTKINGLRQKCYLRRHGLLGRCEDVACGRRTRYVLGTLDSEVHPSCVHGLKHFLGRSGAALGMPNCWSALLPDFQHKPLDVSLVVAHRRNLSRRVRAFMKWIENVLAPHLE